MDYYQYDKSPLRRSNLNKSKLEHSRSKSNPKDNIIRDTSPSFERKPSYNQLKNNRILDAKHYVKILNNISSISKKQVVDYSTKK